MRLPHEIAIFQTVKSKVIISLFEIVRLSVSISLRNLYNSLNSIKESLFSNIFLCDGSDRTVTSWLVLCFFFFCFFLFCFFREVALPPAAMSIKLIFPTANPSLLLR